MPQPLPQVDLPGEVRWGEDCVPFVRTPDEAFASLAGYPFAPHYVEIDGLRMQHLDEGGRDDPVVLLLHGEPSWSYMFREMVTALDAAGYRVVVPDLIGMGRSDKPIEPSDYSYLDHVRSIEVLVESLGLDDVTLVGHDWGAMIGLRVVADAPETFSRAVVINGLLPVFEEGRVEVEVPDPPVPDPHADLPFEVGPMGWAPCDPECRDAWVAHALTDPDFRPSEVAELLGEGAIAGPELDAYDAPYPDEAHMTGIRVFPSLLNTVGEAPTNEAADEWWSTEGVPLLTLFGRRDMNLGSEAVQQRLLAYPGADGQPHHAYPDAGHFLPEEEPLDLVRRVVAFIDSTPAEGG